MCFCYMGMLISEEARQARAETMRLRQLGRYPWTGTVDGKGRRSHVSSIFDDLPAGWKRKIYTPLNKGIEELLDGRQALTDRARCTAAVVDGKLAFTFDCKNARMNEAVAKLAAPLMEKSAFVCTHCGRKMMKREDGGLRCPDCG